MQMVTCGRVRTLASILQGDGSGEAGRWGGVISPATPNKNWGERVSYRPLKVLAFLQSHHVPAIIIDTVTICMRNMTEIRDGPSWQTGRQHFWRRNGCRYPGVGRDLGGCKSSSSQCSPAAPSLCGRGFSAALLLLLLLLILAVVGGLNRSVIAGRIAVGQRR